jgi:hypothetical protein
MLCIPLYIKCQNRDEFSIVFWFCQASTVALAGWIYAREIPVDTLAKALLPGEGHRLLTA